MNQEVNSKGFTLTELMLAMAFIAVLILAIAMTVVQVSTIYAKGMTLKEVNQAGRDISNDLRRTIATRDQIEASDDVEVTQSGARIGGRLCLGTMTYLWNYGEAIQAGTSGFLLKYGGGASDFVRIGKIPDPTKKYCAVDPSTGVVSLTNIPTAERSQYRALTGQGDASLNIYKFNLITVNNSQYSNSHDLSTNQRLYTIEYTLGSGRASTMMPDFSKCKEPGTPGADPQYCMVEDFSLVVRAGNKVN